MLFLDIRLFPANKLILCKLWIQKELKNNFTLSGLLITFSAYSAEWAEKVIREQSTAYRAFKSIIHQPYLLMFVAVKFGFAAV